MGAEKPGSKFYWLETEAQNTALQLRLKLYFIFVKGLANTG